MSAATNFRASLSTSCLSPFRSDPIVAARTKFIDENGGRSFSDYSVPQAVITLKQGIGRLIRSKTDRGVIAILDSRLRTKSYGRDFLNSLPKGAVTSELSDVERMFANTEWGIGLKVLAPNAKCISVLAL